MLDKLTWLGHASFRISGQKLIYIDPWKLKADDEADIVLISHSHYDHYSADDLKMVSGPKTVVVTVAELKSKIGGNVRVVAPGDKIDVGGVGIEAVPAYNIDKKFHPKQNGWVGFVVEMGGERLYYAGDTDAIPEMDNLTNIDLALMPVGGTYTMTAEEAAKAADRFKPAAAVPYHWGDIVGSKSDADRFKEIFSGKTVILSEEK